MWQQLWVRWLPSGVARYFGNMASGAMSATAGLVTAARNEVALAEAQFRGTQIATARARAAVYRAQQAVAAARGTEMQIAAEARLAATQERLNRNIAARSAAQNALNSTTAVGSRLMSGALGLVGGVPGLVMLGGCSMVHAVPESGAGQGVCAPVCTDDR